MKDQVYSTVFTEEKLIRRPPANMLTTNTASTINDVFRLAYLAVNNKHEEVDNPDEKLKEQLITLHCIPWVVCWLQRPKKD